MRKSKPYHIVAAYDSETTNLQTSDGIIAFPILHQVGVLDDGILIEDVTVDNVETVCNVDMFRHTLGLYEWLDGFVAVRRDHVPVMMCHNLSFDMYGLSPWLNRHDVKVLAKSPRKPISFTVLDEAGEPVLVIWDTLIFSQQGLARMGDDCGYPKAVGKWDYDAIRTPDTPLTQDELTYATHDIYALFAWFGWWLRRNPDIDPSRLGLNVVTKTGVVRERRRVRFDRLKGNRLGHNVGRFFYWRCREEAATTDDELYTMLSCTRGGLTFVSQHCASIPYDLQGTGSSVHGFDAASMHPAQIVSHMYPVGFEAKSPEVLDLAWKVVSSVSVERVLQCWDKPFPVAFDACFEFVNLRPKPGGMGGKHGIFPLASARLKPAGDLLQQMDDDNGDRLAYLQEMNDYRDMVTGAVTAFGKLVSADKVRLYLTELAAWEVCQTYDYDSVRAVHGYMTGRFVRPSDMDMLSVMQFYKGKDLYKHARGEYKRTGTITCGEALRDVGIAPAIVDEMEAGTLPAGDVEAVYLGLKADLNSIFGISASNEYRRPTILTSSGIGYTGEFGLVNQPKNPKVWYQFGQRIVGWSRVAQTVVIHLLSPYVDKIINGDTDSVKVICPDDMLPVVDGELSRLGEAIDRGKERVCTRVRLAYPRYFVDLPGIGHYEHEFSVKRFCASWNKAYVMEDGGYKFTIAGIPTKCRETDISTFIGLDGFADRLSQCGWSFGEVCDLYLGYDVTFAHDVLRLNGRKIPAWGDMVYMDVTDRDGKSCKVAEPAALALYPMSKTINDTSRPDNRVNLGYALANRPTVNHARKLVTACGVLDLDDWSSTWESI